MRFYGNCCSYRASASTFSGQSFALVVGRVLMKLLCLLSPLIVLAPALSGKTVHVSPQALSDVPPNQQFRTIQAAAKIADAGDQVIIHSGVYREAVVVEKSGTADQPIRFEAAVDANVVVTGLDPLTNWRKEAGNVFSTVWPYRFVPNSKTGAFPDNEYHRLIGRVEQVLVNGDPLHQTLDRNQLSRGDFCADLANRRLYISPPGGEDVTSAKSGVVVGASTRPLLWHSKGEYVNVRGIRFCNAANRAQKGGVAFQGRGDVAEDCIFEQMSGAGATFGGADQVARRCSFRQNGQLGFLAVRAHNLFITESTIQENNTKGFDRQWEAGGNKIVLSRGVIFEKSRFVRNHGAGIWFDIGNENCTVRNCLIADNEDAGIFYEISYGLHAQDNVVVGNGFFSNPHAWGAQAGIVLSSSPDCEVTRNLLVGNREVFNFREQARRTARIDRSEPGYQEEVWNHDDHVSNNVIAYNRNAQTRGWFGVSDQRQWPRKLQEAKPKNAAPPIQGISLETLHLDLSQNLYAVEHNQPLFIWGVNWLRHIAYPSIVAIQSDLGLEQGSVVAPLAFKNLPERDFRLPRGSQAFEMNCYPSGSVPDVRLGAD